MCIEFCSTGEVYSLRDGAIDILKNMGGFTKVLLDEIESDGSVKNAIQKYNNPIEEMDRVSAAHIWTAKQKGDLFEPVCISEKMIGADLLDCLMNKHLDGKLEKEILFNDEWDHNKILFKDNDIPVVMFVVDRKLKSGTLTFQEPTLNRAQRRKLKKR